MNDTKQEASSRDQQQRVDQVCEFVQAQLGVFSRQGAIVATCANTKGENSALITGWHGGKRAVSGRRYLGCSTWVVEKVRELLARVQQELRQGRQLRRLERTARAAMRWSKGLLRKELGRLGLWLKGFEVRGGRLADALQFPGQGPAGVPETRRGGAEEGAFSFQRREAELESRL